MKFTYFKKIFRKFFKSKRGVQVLNSTSVSNSNVQSVHTSYTVDVIVTPSVSQTNNTSKMDDDKYQLSTVKFSGIKSDFVFWAPRFLSYAEHNGFVDILLGTTKPVDRSQVLDPIVDAAKIKIRKLNAAAYSALHAACRDTISFNAINNSITLEQPLGDGFLAWTITSKQFLSRQVQLKNMNLSIVSLSVF